MVREAPAGHQMELKLVWNHAVQYGSHRPLVAIEHLKCGHSKLRCAVRLQYILDIDVLASTK